MRAVARTATKPVLATFMGTEGAIPLLAPIPTYRFPEGAIAALSRVVAYADWRQRPRGAAPDFSPRWPTRDASLTKGSSGAGDGSGRRRRSG